MKFKFVITTYTTVIIDEPTLEEAEVAIKKELTFNPEKLRNENPSTTYLGEGVSFKKWEEKQRKYKK